MVNLIDLDAASLNYCEYESACEAAGVSVNCPHGFRWNRCLDGCRVIKVVSGMLHFEQQIGDKRYICRGHVETK